MFEYSSDNKYVMNQKIIVDGEIVEIIEYYENTPADDFENSVKYRHFISEGGIEKTEELSKETQEIIFVYQYEKKAKFDDRHVKLRFSFKIENGYVTSAQRYEPGTDEVVAKYGYIKGTIFGDHAGMIDFRNDYSNGVLQKIVYYGGMYPNIKQITEYYPCDENEDINQYIKKVIDFAEEDRVIRAITKEEKTKEVKFVYYFFPEAKLGNHMKHVEEQYVFDQGKLIRKYKYESGLHLAQTIDYIDGTSFDIQTRQFKLNGNLCTEEDVIKRHYFMDEESFIDYAIDYQQKDKLKLTFSEFSKIENKKNKIIKKEKIK